MPSVMHIATLRIYPVKALRGFDVPSARLERTGLQHDRRWAIAAPDGTVLTQRDLPAMARIDAHVDSLIDAHVDSVIDAHVDSVIDAHVDSVIDAHVDSVIDAHVDSVIDAHVDGAIDARIEGAALRLECAGHGGIDAHPTETPFTLDVWRTKIPTTTANPEASAWLSKVLGTPCTLVHQPDPQSRPVTPDLARPGDHVSLADGFPLLVTTTASLADLNRRLATLIPMDRFRPNLVIEGATPWAEDTWSHLHAGPTRLRLASPCSRCKVTTLDQQTGLAPARTEPLKTLGTFHRDPEGRITFGWNAIPETLGTIHLGAAVKES